MTSSGNDRTRRDTTHETPVLSVLETRIREIERSHRDPIDIPSVKRLTSIFGMGDHPALRRAAFRRIETAAFKFGPPAVKIIWMAVHRSKGKASPDRWFLTVVLDELERAGLLDLDEHGGDPLVH